MSGIFKMSESRGNISKPEIYSINEVFPIFSGPKTITLKILLICLSFSETF